MGPVDRKKADGVEEKMDAAKDRRGTRSHI